MIRTGRRHFNYLHERPCFTKASDASSTALNVYWGTYGTVHDCHGSTGECRPYQSSQKKAVRASVHECSTRVESLCTYSDKRQMRKSG
jgi:hypothetical protein